MARDIKQRCARCGKAISDWHYVNNKPVCIDDRLCYRRQNRKYRKQKSKNKVLARVKSKNKVLARVKSRYGGEL